MTAARLSSLLPMGAAVLLLLSTSCRGKPVAPERIVVLVLDALHAPHLSTYGGPAGLTPNIDALSERGMQFERALANANWTLPSTATLMTGQSPAHHGLIRRERRVPSNAVVLSELFRAAGFRTAAFSQMAYVSPDFGFDRGFDDFSYYVLDEQLGPERTLGDVERWLAEHADERFFAYVHLRRPHSPYDPSAEYRMALDPDGPLADGRRDVELARADTFGVLELQKPALDRLEVLYRANLAQQDAEIGNLLVLLERLDVLVVLTSDHGEALGRDGYFGHGQDVAPSNVHIPLIVAGPGVAAGVSDATVSTADLAPTLVELFDLERPSGAEFDGTSYVQLLRGAEPSAPRTSVLFDKFRRDGPEQVAIVEGRYQLTLDREQGPRLFDRESWTSAEDDVSGEQRTILERLLERAERELATAEQTALAADDGNQVSESIEADLRALGYVDD